MNFDLPFKLLLMLVFTVILAGCSTSLSKSGQQTAEERVKQRSEERWGLVIESRLETAYTYLSPTYREVTPYSHYARKIKNVGIWEKAVVESVTCEQKSCMARVKINTVTHHPMLKEPIRADSYIDETWIKLDDFDDWYLKPNFRR